jgi:hypothetical protein
MSGTTSFPYSFDSRVLTDRDVGVVAELEAGTRPLKQTYDNRLTVALTWLANYCPDTQPGLNDFKRILEIMVIGAPDPVTSIPVRIPPRATQLATEVMKRAAALDRHPLGVGLLQAAAAIWQHQAPRIWATLDSINRTARLGITLAAPPQPFTESAWDTLLEVVRRLYVAIITAFGRPDPLLEQYKTVVHYVNATGITARLFECMLFASKTSTPQGGSVDKFLQAWLMSQVVGPVHDSLLEINAALRGPVVAYDKVKVPGWHAEIHNGNNGSALNLNANLIRWFSDAGLSAFAGKIPNLTEEMIEGLSEIDKAHHYANDAYRNYLLIIHDTLFYRFMGARNNLPQVAKAEWDKARREQSGMPHPLETIDEFVSEIFFIDISGLVGADMRTPAKLQAFAAGKQSTKFEECPLSLALGKSYEPFLRKAALDSTPQRVQIRTETLFEFIVMDAFRNLQSIAHRERGHSKPHDAILHIIDTIEKKIHDMSRSIATVFTILNNPKVHSAFLDPEQIHEGDVISLVKIRNDNRDYGNRRLDITLDSHARAMMLRYEVQPRMLYKNFMARKNARKEAAGGGDACADANEQIKLFKSYLALGKPKRVMENVVKAYIDARAKCRNKKLIQTQLMPAAMRAMLGGDDAAAPAQRNMAAAAAASAARPTKLSGVTLSNPTGLNKAGPVALTAGVAVEPLEDDTLPAPEGVATAETAVPRGRQSTYVFGPFTRIYKPDEQPYNIAAPGQTEAQTIQATIVNRLLAGKNVCIFGYGQSGSGKTSLLVYYKKREDKVTGEIDGEMGVMSYICNWLSGSDSPYEAIKCDIREIGVIPTEQANGVQVIDGTKNPFYSTKYFRPAMVTETVMDGRESVTKQMQSWTMSLEDLAKLPALRKLSADTPPANYSAKTDARTRYDALSDNAAEQNKIAAHMKWRQAKGVPDGDPSVNYVAEDALRSIGGYVFFSTENKRLTKATTNNPTSSRSHIFVFLQFIPRVKGAPAPFLIIGDFAGVENRFACSNSAVLRSFATIKKYPEQRDSVDAYEPELRAAYDAQVRPLLVGSKFATVPYRDLEPKFAAMASQSTANWSELTSFARMQSDEEMKKGAKFPETTIAKFIKDVSSIKRTEKMMKVYPHHLNDDQIGPFNDMANANPIRRLVMNWLIYKRWSDAQIYINGSDAKADAQKALKMLAIFEKVESMTEAEVLLYELVRASTELFMGSECNQRVREGEYINNSLEVFRNFLSRSLQRKGAVPKVLGECATIQCNPFFNDCFGSTFSTPESIGMVETTLVQMLKPAEFRAMQNLTAEQRYAAAQTALADLTYCVFNVINISKDRNDPPPTPYIDCNHLVFEYNRVMSIPARMEYLGAKKTGDPVNMLGTPFDMRILQELESRVNRYADEAEHWARADPSQMNLAQAATAAGEARRDAIKAIEIAKAMGPKTAGADMSPEFMPAVKNVILTLERINAATFVGTMMFTDTLAKFGLNRTMCALPSEGPNGDPVEYLNTILFGNISRLHHSIRKMMCDGILRGDHCSETAQENAVGQDSLASAQPDSELPF